MHEEGKELVILGADKDYCWDCSYIIWIESIGSINQFELVWKSIKANETYSQLIKIGTSKKVKTSPSSPLKIFQFLIEEATPVTITPTIFSGDPLIFVSLNGKLEDVFTGGRAESIVLKDEWLMTNTNYYLLVQCNTGECDLSVIVK